jgi:hypothetical protein
MPKLGNINNNVNNNNTNNIFYIINQNPQVNTQITIYNNSDKKEDSQNENKLSVNTFREKENNLLNQNNTRTIFKITEKNKNFKKLQNLKPDLYNIFNKNRNTINIGSSTNRKLTPNSNTNTDTITTNNNNNNKLNINSQFGTTINKFNIKANIIEKEKERQKEKRDVTPSLTARQVNLILIF